MFLNNPYKNVAPARLFYAEDKISTTLPSWNNECDIGAWGVFTI